ncbi:helix-turn-helix transcriptional regulator [Aquimarina sp. 2201CG5-10]|uniref:helix-turn-helix transcriptional regulator n=1 Tax=Aquimarina callyspongiae TaxID=3098150 RepID=UPI002AB41C91|nr:helix-turn-helix transcriptional regulator [Aquimarina sp. 2201CG5-10]MDY8137351.1 helix-turn-helix transcriptional regulator [Aquimarina sp. 2201CG5-10]
MNSIESFAFIITFLLGGVILIGCFMMLIILKSTSLKQSRYFLAFTILGLIQHLVTYLLFTTQLIKQWPHLFGVGYPLFFLVGPLFFMFIKSYADSTFRLKLVDVVHLLPFFGIQGLFIPKYFENAETKLSMINYYYDILPNGAVSFSVWLQNSMHLLLLLGYAIIAFVYVYRKDKKNSILLKRFSILLGVLALTELLLQTGFLLSGASAITAEIVLSALMSIAILLLGYWIVDIKQVLPVLEGTKYKTSPLSETRSRKIKKDIQVYFEKEDFYLNPNLKIADLAKAIGVPSHHISQVLSEQMQASFYEIVNKYRIDKAKEMLRSGALNKLSVQAIGEECGFSSKTSFYRAFKKVTQMTPTVFIQKETTL